MFFLAAVHPWLGTVRGIVGSNVNTTSSHGSPLAVIFKLGLLNAVKVLRSKEKTTTSSQGSSLAMTKLGLHNADSKSLKF